MISKKAKMVGATVVLAAAGFGITTVASAHRGDSTKDQRIVHVAPMHDRRNGERLDAVSGLLGITSDEWALHFFLAALMLSTRLG